jgi:hypothetical protein
VTGEGELIDADETSGANGNTTGPETSDARLFIDDSHTAGGTPGGEANGKHGAEEPGENDEPGT